MRNNKVSNYNIVGFRKILIGFIIVILLALFNAVFNSVIIQKNKSIITHITGVINPYIETLDEFNLLVTRSKMYITNWVYLQHNEADKHKLDILHKEEYPAVKKHLEKYTSKLGTQADVDSIEAIFKDFESLIRVEREIMAELATFDDYEMPLKKFTAEDLLESEVIPRSEALFLRLDRLTKLKRAEAEEMRSSMVSSFNRLIVTILFIAFSFILLVLLAGYYISGSIKKPIIRMKQMVLKLGRGELPEERLKITQDVVGEMVEAVNTLTESFQKTSQFANEIGRGNLKADFTPLSDKDQLGNALINMRESLRVYSENLEHKVEERTLEVREKNLKLELAYKEIRDSINYAKKLQEAVLPSMEYIKEYLPESFILFIPKDIVCGDFYWFTHKGKKAILATADCTGHGVPGAFMSMLGHNLLNQIIIEQNIDSPAAVLTELNQDVKTALKQNDTGSETRDGMDIALCAYNLSDYTLTYAGANRSLFIIRKSELLTYVPNKQAIGGFTSKEYIFNEQTIPVERGDMVYTFTDGYTDQFGGTHNKKFMTKRFKSLLMEIKNKPMELQKEILRSNYETWRADNEQVDDILVMGVKIV